MLGLKTISLVLALIIPLYPNLSLLSEGEKELISTQNIKTKKDAINQIEILEKNAEYSKNYKEAIILLE